MATDDPLSGFGDLLGGAAPDGLPAGLGDAIGGLLGGGSGGSGATAGLDDLVKGFQQAGLTDQVQSWIGTGPNQPVTPDQIGQALGPDKVQQLAGSTGIDVASLLPMLAAFLPQIINALTPNGQLPKAGEGADPADVIGGLLKGLGA